MTTISRDHIVELMGRGCSEIANTVGLASFADMIDVNEDRHTPEQIAAMFKANRAKGETSNFVLMQERKSLDEIEMMNNRSKFLADVMNAANDKTIRITTLGFLQRGAKPSCRDRYLAVRYARAVMDLALSGRFGLGVSWANDQVATYEIALQPIEQTNVDSK